MDRYSCARYKVEILYNFIHKCAKVPHLRLVEENGLPKYGECKLLQLQQQKINNTYDLR